MDDTLLLHYYGICERTSSSLFAEPLNVLTNMGFFIVAALVLRKCRHYPDLHGYKIYDIYLLTFLTFMIGAGSTLFHMHPTPLTEAIDMAPIIVFINVYFLSAMRRIVKCNWFETGVCYIAFGGFTHILVSNFPNALNDSIGYLSSMTALIAIALYLNLKRRATARAFLVAAIIGVVSLFFRSVDNAVCEKLSTGTHFLWHALNAVLIYILLIQLIRNVNRRARMLRAANLHFA